MTTYTPTCFIHPQLKLFACLLKLKSYIEAEAGNVLLVLYFLYTLYFYIRKESSSK